MLLLNKQSHETLRLRVYRHALLRCQHERLQTKRIPLWKLIMGFKDLQEIKYSELKQEVDLNRELI